jgi:hypothetical protein
MRVNTVDAAAPPPSLVSRHRAQIFERALGNMVGFPADKLQGFEGEMTKSPYWCENIKVFRLFGAFQD